METIISFVCDLLLGVMYWTFRNNSFVSLCNWRNDIAKNISLFKIVFWALHCKKTISSYVCDVSSIYVKMEETFNSFWEDKSFSGRTSFMTWNIQSVWLRRFVDIKYNFFYKCDLVIGSTLWTENKDIWYKQSIGAIT